MKRKDIISSIKKAGMPLSLKEISRIYLFGSALYKEEPRDIDVALFVSPLHKLFADDIRIQMCHRDNVEYHILPDTKWHRRRLNESSENKRLFKIEMRLA